MSAGGGDGTGSALGGGAGRALSALSLPDLQRLGHAVERGRLVCPLSRAGLLSEGFGEHATDVVAALGELTKEAVLAAVHVALAERTHHRPPKLDVVWTGPESRVSTARDTAIVVKELFSEARHEVILGGFSFDHGEEIFRPLHAAMKQHGARAIFFLDIEGHAPDASGAEAYASAQIDSFFAHNWPFGDPRPDVYYDPRTARPGPPWASLHAKCVVVNRERALVTSANFTDRGRTRNIEAGVLIADRAFAGELAAHWHALRESGAVRRYQG